jgi:hypothetical protein
MLDHMLPILLQEVHFRIQFSTWIIEESKNSNKLGLTIHLPEGNISGNYYYLMPQLIAFA